MKFQLEERPVNILLVEDNPGDVDLMLETLETSKFLIHMNAVSDGEQAMAYLRQVGRYVNAARPDLILLDLNLPIKDGRETLTEIKSDVNLKKIPVVILTTSSSEEDIIQAYELQASCYITKPVDLEQFVKVVNAIEGFWLAVVKLPPK
jgi:CheY-like chemotaxis protein